MMSHTLRLRLATVILCSTSLAQDPTVDLSKVGDAVDRLVAADGDGKRRIHDEMCNAAQMWAAACLETAARSLHSPLAKDRTTIRLLYGVFEADLSVAVSDTSGHRGDAVSAADTDDKDADRRPIQTALAGRLSALVRMYPLLAPENPAAADERGALVVCMALAYRADKGSVRRLARERQGSLDGAAALPFTAILSAIQSDPPSDTVWPSGTEAEARRLVLRFRVISRD